MINIGVLALQGDFLEHYNTLKKIKNIRPIYVKTIQNLENIQGLIIPGGESTTIGKLLKKTKLDIAIKKAVKKGMGIYGTCAGCVLLAKKVDSPYSLKLIDIEVKRNAYGRQIESFNSPFGFFIRAPKIIKLLNNKVKILKKYKKEIILVQQNNILAGTFHPELTHNTKIHQYFLENCLTPRNN
jgi:5'-phosphate synthase pdxT subunit